MLRLIPRPRATRSVTIGSMLLAATLSLVCAQATATTVRDFSLRDLVRTSHDCIRVRVSGRDGAGTGVIRYRLEAVERIYGSLPNSFQVDVPANLVGAPELSVGAEYVLFLNLNNRVEPIIGLRWGSFRLSGPDDAIRDGFGRWIAARPSPQAAGDYRLERATQRGSKTATYPEFRARIQAVRQSHIAAGGRQPERPRP